jgi:hypothetical protein
VRTQAEESDDPSVKSELPITRKLTLRKFCLENPPYVPPGQQKEVPIVVDAFHAYDSFMNSKLQNNETAVGIDRFMY